MPIQHNDRKIARATQEPANRFSMLLLQQFKVFSFDGGTAQDEHSCASLVKDDIKLQNNLLVENPAEQNSVAAMRQHGQIRIPAGQVGYHRYRMALESPAKMDPKRVAKTFLPRLKNR